jgi:hypothetical protein
MDPNSLAEAMAQMQAQELAANTQQATDAASQAAQQYQQQAQAPSPDLDPMAAFIPTLLSNIASVIGKEPSYRENTQDQEQRLNCKNRADNPQHFGTPSRRLSAHQQGHRVRDEGPHEAGAGIQTARRNQ